MLREPDIITIETSHDAVLSADHAFVYLKMEGSAAFSPQAVMRQSKEIAALLDRLVALGLPVDATEVTGVEASVAKEGLRRSSTSVHHVRITVRALKHLPSVIALIPRSSKRSFRESSGATTPCGISGWNG